MKSKHLLANISIDVEHQYGFAIEIIHSDADFIDR